MLVGIVLLIAVNAIATQFVAYRLEYQPGLGTPILHYQRHFIYQPFAWTSWLLGMAVPRTHEYGFHCSPEP